jgi:hypothetical protein
MPGCEAPVIPISVPCAAASISREECRQIREHLWQTAGVAAVGRRLPAGGGAMSGLANVDVVALVAVRPMSLSCAGEQGRWAH